MKVRTPMPPLLPLVGRSKHARVAGTGPGEDARVPHDDPPPRWLFADQLGPHFLDDDRPDQPVLLVESRAVFRRRRFHRAKAHLVLSALRHRAAELGDRATYVRAETYGEALGQVGADRLEVVHPTTYA